jgi:hypothetical protein
MKTELNARMVKVKVNLLCIFPFRYFYGVTFWDTSTGSMKVYTIQKKTVKFMTSVKKPIYTITYFALLVNVLVIVFHYGQCGKIFIHI